DWSFERDLVAQNRIEQFLRQCFTEFFEGLGAREMSFPLNFNARRFDDPHYACGDFRADAVARNQCDSMHNHSIQQMRDHHDIVIVGGGVIGLTIARALALRGVSDVCVVERGNLGTEASWAAAGMLSPQVEADAQDDFFDLACRSRDLYPA